MSVLSTKNVSKRDCKSKSDDSSNSSWEMLSNPRSNSSDSLENVEVSPAHNAEDDGTEERYTFRENILTRKEDACDLLQKMIDNKKEVFLSVQWQLQDERPKLYYIEIGTRSSSEITISKFSNDIIENSLTVIKRFFEDTNTLKVSFFYSVLTVIHLV